MDVRLLGPIEARSENGPIDLGPRKQRAVLAMLALEAGRTVSASRLEAGLWGDKPPPSAPKMVQLYVSHLRRLFEGNGARIVTRGRGYELRLSEGDVDAIRFERLLEESRAREALEQWGGEALADVADEPFAAAEIRRLDGLRLRAAETAIEHDLVAGRHAAVIGELESLVAEQPLREHLHAQRMLALYRSGRQAEALEAYRDARSALVEQIGVEPGAELRRLQDAILAHDPNLELGALTAPPTSPPVSRPTPHRPARRVLAAAAALLVAGVTAFGVIRVIEPDSLPGISENAVGLIDPDGGRITAQYPVGRSPGAVAAGAGSIWVANTLDGTVSRIDRGDDPAVTIPVDGTPAALAFGAGSLWVADSDAREVAQIDPGANKVRLRIEVGNAPRALAVTAGALWVASGVDGRIQRIDFDRGRVTRSIAIGANPTAIVAGAGALWVASEEAGTVTRIEPRTGRVVRPIQVGNGPSALATGEGAVWVLNRQDGTLSRIDPATNAVSGTVGVGSDPTAVAVGGGAVWVAGGEEGTVVRVEPNQLRVERTVTTGSSSAAIVFAGGSVWAAAAAPVNSHRGGTLRVLVPSERMVGASVPIDWLHPDAYSSWLPSQLSSLAYDGLVGYRRVEGAAGATLVGALATSAPPPSRDGQSYVFSLRRGVRYSDGRPVEPADFRTSMERFLRVTRDRFPPLYAGIVGARRCVTIPARCDLSRGIETDARARTITIRLMEPDAEFLHKLSMAFAYVVPGDSSSRATIGRPPPGTGPYRVAAWNAHRGGTFVRNPHFRPRPARPDGFADQIKLALGTGRTLEPQIADVMRGTADLAVLANPFSSEVTSERLRALETSSPGQVHSDPAPTTDWLFLNVQRRPFDDINVRRAVNLAIDRAHVVELTGGPDTGQPTCQVVPVAFPGYEPYCPYTKEPATGRGWRAPDMGRARRLVKASGRSGERVLVKMPVFRREVGRYYAELLEDLGFRVTLRVQPGAQYEDDVYDASSRAQTGFVGWAADYITPSTFIQIPFACASSADRLVENLSRICDRTLARQVDSALAALPADAAKGWAAADRRVTDLAAAVPMTNRRSAVLVSKRVGNVTHHPQWFTLLDQVWVR